MITPYRSPIKPEVAHGSPATPVRSGLVLVFELLEAKRICVDPPRSDGSPRGAHKRSVFVLIRNPFGVHPCA